MSLFSILAVVSGLKRTNIFEIISRKMISLFHTARNVILALIFGTFLFDLIVANDMSLITFLPLTFIVLSTTGNRKYMMFTFIMQTIAANMAGMITPHGNPQNLFLYSYFQIPTLEFVQILLPEFIVTALLLFIITNLVIPKEKLELKTNDEIVVDKINVTVYTVLFVLTIASIFRLLPHVISFGVVAAVVLLYDRKTFTKIDFGLLLSFCMFFVFSGNMARIPQIEKLISGMVNDNTLIAGLISCQFISNVPTAIFLSRFTNNYADLVVAVNIGSLGIMISSLASLITLKEFLKHEQGKLLKYFGMYTLMNTIFFIILIITYLISNLI
jgi:Na+/H+ antiporter NhaD/arsenite permease-like protein